MATGFDADAFSEQLRAFLQNNKIISTNPDKLINYIINDIGAYGLDDLKMISPELLKEELTGLKYLQQMKFIEAVKNQGSNISTIKPVTNNSDQLIPPIKKAESSMFMKSRGITVSIRYILCHDLFIKETTQKVIPNLSLHHETLRTLIDLIRGQERVIEDRKVDLFTQEGYPITVNQYNEDCPLSKWNFENSSLVYVFIRRRQADELEYLGNDVPRDDSTHGTHTLKIHSIMYGTFCIPTNMDRDTGESIKQRVFSCKSIHPNCFNLKTRPTNLNYESECIDNYSNENLQVLASTTDNSEGTHTIELLLTTTPLYSCKSGVEYCFGKCTYLPVVDQTDKGFAKFFSILYTLLHGDDKILQSRLLTFLQKEYDLPPLTYSLKVLFHECSLEQFPCWVALIEGFYQLFKAILNEFFVVPDNKVFECSDYLWGMLCKQAMKLPYSEVLQWKQVLLTCAISNNKMIEPVRLPRCLDVFEKVVILQRIKYKLAVPGCDIKELSEEKLKKADDIEKLLMLSDFHNCNCTYFTTWDIVPEKEKVIGPLELPTDVTWKYICDCKSKFKVKKDSNQPNDLVYYNGKVAVIVRIIKDVELRRELYDPLYDPRQNHGNVTVLKSSINFENSSDFDLKTCLRPNLGNRMRGQSITSSVDLQFGQNAMDITQRIKKTPAESVVVILDSSSSMNSAIFNDTTKDGQHMSRLRAAKELFLAFLNRTEGFSYHHAVALIKCSTVPSVEVELTDDYDLFKQKIDSLNAGGGTALYDSMIKGAELLDEIKTTFPTCKRRLFCLTDGDDQHSKSSVKECFRIIKEKVVLVDSVLIVGPGGNINQKALSHGSGGFCFLPQSMENSLKIFETETILSSKVRCLRQEAMSDSLEHYKNIETYPYNALDFYGQNDLRTQFAYELSKSNFTNPARIVQHSALFGMSVSMSTKSLRQRRILQEIQKYLKAAHPHIDIYPQEDNIGRWKIVLLGPENTPYEGGTFILFAKFPDDYPQKPPEIRFETPIYHCNINSNGRICHSSLDSKYVPKQSMKSLLEQIYGLLMSPEPDDPLDSVLALELLTNRPGYEERARQLVRKFATERDRTDYRRDIVGDDSEGPDILVCPLTRKLFVDPVITEYGHTYERNALMEHLQDNNDMDPLAKKPVNIEKIAPNISLKGMVDLFKKTELRQ